MLGRQNEKKSVFGETGWLSLLYLVCVVSLPKQIQTLPPFLQPLKEKGTLLSLSTFKLLHLLFILNFPGPFGCLPRRKLRKDNL